MSNFYLSLFLTFFLLTVPPVVVAAESGALFANVDKHGVALGGYDPVSYFDGVPVAGREAYLAKYQGVTYLFDSRNNLHRFIVEPERYLPAYGGWCAWAMLDGKKVAIDPERYKIIEGRLYLFYDGFWGDTLKKWNERAETETDMALVGKSDEQWRKLYP